MVKLPINVLFLSYTNVARSILAEACLNQYGKGQFHAFSCGMPGQTGDPIPNPILNVLDTAGFAKKGLHSKSWNEFTRMCARPMDFVISLDEATFSDHPRWPRQPCTALWPTPPILTPGIDDSQMADLTLRALYSLRRRVELLVALHMHGFDRSALRSDIRDLAHLQ